MSFFYVFMNLGHLKEYKIWYFENKVISFKMCHLRGGYQKSYLLSYTLLQVSQLMNISSHQHHVKYQGIEKHVQ